MVLQHQSTRATVALALILSLVVVGATPASSANVAMQESDQLVVGSQWTDFGTGGDPSPNTLTNVSVSGSGDAASVTLDSSSGWAPSGEYVLRSPSSTQGGNVYRNITSDTYSSASVWVNVTSFASDTPHLSLQEGSTYGPRLRVNSNGEIDYYDGSSWTGTGITITTGENYKILFQNIDYANNQFDLEVQAADGSTVGSSSGLAMQSGISAISRVFFTDFNTNEYFLDRFEVGGTVIEDWEGSDPLADWSGSTGDYEVVKAGSEGVSSATYIGATHEVSNAEQAAINIEQHSNVSVEATVRTDGGTILNQTTLSGTGNHTLALADTSSSQLETVLDVDVTGTNPSFSLADESILFTNHVPNATNFSPSDGTKTTQNTVTFSTDISDAEFGTVQGDNVTAELFVDGSSVGSKTVSSNQSVSISHDLTSGGNHDYYWELRDEYGATKTTSTRTITVPNTLYLYSETQNSSTQQYELLNGTNTTIDITITGSQGSVKAVTVSDGTVDMTGLPADESYVFSIDPEGYYAREIYIPSIYDQSSVFLLNKSKTAVQNSLTVTDRTGQYEEPIITVERVINTSRVPQMADNDDQWVTIGGDRLGASGFYIVNLQATSRYRFVVINDQGNTRVLGEYTAKADGEVPLEIGTIEYNLGEGESGYKWSTSATNGSGGPAVSFAYLDTQNLTSNLSVTLKYRNNSDIIASKDYTNGPYGEIVFTQPVNNTTYNNREFVVEWSAERNGSMISAERIVGGKRDIRPPLGDKWMEIGYGGGVLIIAFVAGAGAGAAVAAATVSIFAGLAVFLGLAPPALGFGATILGLFLSVAMLVFGGRQQF